MKRPQTNFHIDIINHVQVPKLLGSSYKSSMPVDLHISKLIRPPLVLWQ